MEKKMIQEAIRFNRLTVLADVPHPSGKRHVLTVCDCGTPSVKQWSNIAYEASATKTCGNHGTWGKTRRIGAPMTYHGWHKHLWRTQGPAAANTCVDCPEQALEWSYVGGCEDEYQGEKEGALLSYCNHVQHYVPRCKTCHTNYDVALRKARDEY